MKANSEKTKQSKKATRRVLAGVLCGASVLSLVLSLVMPPISQAIANDAQTVSTEETVMGGGSSSESTDVDNTNNGDTENQNSDETEGGESGDDATGADQLSDDTEADGAAQPADDGEPVYKVATIANEGEAQGLQKDADDYTLLKSGDDLSTYLDMENKPEKLRLAADISSSTPIAISQNTTIDLAGHKLYYRTGNNDTFIKVTSGALTIEDSAKPVDIPSPVGDKNTGRPASMAWDGNNNATLTYYVTTSNPKEDSLGTTETTTRHDVSGFGAIVAASEGGSVQQVISVQDGGTLNLTGGMITTPKNLADNGHIIFAKGENSNTQVNISGGYIAGANLNQQRGGWGGGLCVAGAKVTVNMTGGVIAANKAASGGGIFADSGVTLNLSGGVISGNATYDKGIGNTCGGDTRDGGYGGGVYTKGANVTIGGSANITNNRVDAWIADSSVYNFGLLGGGGIACTHRGTLTMTGGSVTANYSKEAGGGIYAGFHNQPITFSMTGGTIAGNESVNAEGGGLRISTGTTGVIEAASASNKVYITNNKTMTGGTTGRGGDWGGGGVFVQTAGTLNLRAALVTKNEAGGWGGGIGACPTGQTIVTHTNGSAIYSNTDHGENSSAGGNGKNEDSQSKYITDTFKTAGHQDFFLVRNKDGANKTIAVVLGKMLGGGSAGWQGTCDGNPITIDPNGGAEAKYMFGLQANPSPDAVNKAQAAATTIISGNYSYTHGGGIMTNGDLIVGEVTSLDVYPAIKVKANKVLMKDGKPQGLTGHGYKFKLLGKAADSAGEPYWNTDGSLNANGCEATSEVTVNESGEIVIDTAANYQSGNYDLYLVEVPISEEGTTFDKAIYKIHIKVGTTPVNTTNLLGININRYEVDKSASTVSVKREGETGFTECKSLEFYNWSVDPKDNTISTVKIGNSSKPAFTNELAPYQTSGTWTPQVTKKVDGGEMKKFKFELYTMDGSEKTVLDTKSTADDSNNLQTVTFAEQRIGPLKVSDFNDGKATFTYYICECAADAGEGTSHEGYTNDTKTFKVVVTAKDDGNGHLTCTPAYYEVDANNHVSETPTDTPTFTNTYSTTLPLSGMSGVTLTYLAGAAVLCAAAAWMHIRRKANVKGGERRE
mgnify:CR=1 FL=1